MVKVFFDCTLELTINPNRCSQNIRKKILVDMHNEV
jgi:hypothetical protein